jgi:hypothetical protein
VDLSPTEEYTRVRRALLTMRANVILATDLVGRERVEMIAADARDEP